MTMHFLALMDGRRGSMAVEYGLLAALLGVALVVSLTALGVSISTVLNAISEAFAG